MRIITDEPAPTQPQLAVLQEMVSAYKVDSHMSRNFAVDRFLVRAGIDLGHATRKDRQHAHELIKAAEREVFSAITALSNG